MCGQDTRWMRLALSLGARGQGLVWPNPAVGCVLVKEGRVIGRGWTAPGGRPHAEPQALAQAGDAARGATAYVTLEPCAHFGQTPPCVEALIRASVARVVIALTDPDPRTNGDGIARLKQAGIAVTTEVEEDAARRAHQGFLSCIQLGRPALTLKLATSFDGRIATENGDSQWITGPDARRHVHATRARHDAVLVGAGTVRTDDPTLTVRGLGITHQPVRVVISSNLDIPQNSNLAKTAAEISLWLVCADTAPAPRQTYWKTLGATILPVETTADGRPDMIKAFQALGDQGLTRIFCEGGGHLAASLLKSDLVDDLIGYTGGVILGGDSQPAIAGMSLNALSEAPRFCLRRSHSIGADTLHEWARQR